MAGPGGGPPRKSHTKSRKGCKTCKRRHIRCDEQYPQCRNCTKHNTRCDYNDNPEDAPKSPKGPDLRLNPRIEAEIDNWICTGIFPFPGLGLSTQHQFDGLGKVDLRLVHHLSSVYQDLQRRTLLSCIPSIEKLPIFLDAAADNSFVMSAVLAFSANHLAWLTGSAETKSLALGHRGTALTGLSAAVGNFSAKNSDSVLAASILLTWQITDWDAWTSVTQGTSTIISLMGEWKQTSRLASYVEKHVIYRRPSFVQSLGPLNGHFFPEDDGSLQDAIYSLQQFCTNLESNSSLYGELERIIQAAQEIQKSCLTLPVPALFEKMQFFRMQLLWVPINLMQGAEIPNLSLLVMAQLYALGLSIDASIPELCGAALGALTTAAIEEIDRKITQSHFFTHQQSLECETMDDMMTFPRRMIAKHSYRGTPFSPASEPQLSGQQSPYGFQNLQLGSAPHTPSFPPSLPRFGNMSVEDLSVPPSPFLKQTYPSPSSRRQSYLGGHGSRTSSMTFEHRPFSTLAPRGDSPAYSPAYSPAQGYFEDEQKFSFGDSLSSGYISGDTSFDDSAEQQQRQQYHHQNHHQHQNHYAN